jgi:hypothetical protein
MDKKLAKAIDEATEAARGAITDALAAHGISVDDLAAENAALIRHAQALTASVQLSQALIDSIDRNARAYGYEIGQLGYGADDVLPDVVDSTPGNPFLSTDWRTKVNDAFKLTNRDVSRETTEEDGPETVRTYADPDHQPVTGVIPLGPHSARTGPSATCTCGWHSHHRTFDEHYADTHPAPDSTED